jgi:hypothetical protein
LHNRITELLGNPRVPDIVNYSAFSTGPYLCDLNKRERPSW